MNPKPFSSLNHFTVPVAMFPPGRLCAARRERCWKATVTKRRHCFAGLLPGPARECSRERGRRGWEEAPGAGGWEETVAIRRFLPTPRRGGARALPGPSASAGGRASVPGMVRAVGHGALGRATFALAALLPAAALAGCGGAAGGGSTRPAATAPPPAVTQAARARPRVAARPRRGSSAAGGRSAGSGGASSGGGGASAGGGGPSTTGGLPVSRVSSSAVAPQPPPGSCHARGSGLYSLPDPHCTPGALSPAVTQANIASTICSPGYTETVRPPESITEPEKEASLAAYGDSGPLHDYEYDHLVPLELGGAPNDPRNLWPEPGPSPNPKDALENRLRQAVCDGQMTLARAQRAIATDWVALARPQPAQPTGPSPSSAAQCSASARYNSRYDDWDVYVHSNQPDRPVTVTGAGAAKTWHTDSTGYADVYFHAGRSAAGERITVQVGTATCSATL